MYEEFVNFVVLKNVKMSNLTVGPKKWMQDTNESHFIWSTKVRNITKARSIDGISRNKNAKITLQAIHQEFEMYILTTLMLRSKLTETYKLSYFQLYTKNVKLVCV